MAEDALHPNVAFATKFGDPTGDYLNAFTALVRVEGLIEDAERLEGILTSVRNDSEQWSPWHGADIVSYYSVGLVTCLEWHARSRIADLARFAPVALKSDDLKGQVSEKVMIQLLTQGASVANLISAATNVGSFSKYMGVFNRVLSALGSTRDAYDFAKDTDPKTGKPWLTTADIDDLKSLFVFRNELTHEIGRGVVGHLNVREAWAPDDAVAAGKRIQKLMRAMEAAVTALAPDDFPNLLDDNFWPVWRLERLKAEIVKLEAKILPLIEQVHFGNQDRTKEEWLIALETSKRHQQSESNFVEHASILHNKYIDLTGPLQEHIAQSRYDYLTMLLKHSSVLWSDNPDLAEAAREADENADGT